MASQVFGDSLASFHDIAFSSYQQDDIGKLLSKNSTLPVSIASLKITGAGRRTRQSLLEAQVDPILNAKGPMTLPQLLSELDAAAARFKRFGTYSDVRFKLDLASVNPLKALEAATNDSNSLLEPYRGIEPLDLKATLYLTRANPHPLKIKTLVRDDGPAAFTASAALKNIFGGAESLAVAVTKESKPSSALSYAVDLTTPISVKSPDTRVHLSAFKSDNAVAYPQLSYATKAQGSFLKLVTQSPIYPSSFAEFGVSAIKRALAPVGDSSLPEFVSKHAANESFKTSFFTRFVIDHRTFSPTSPEFINGGHMFDWQTEVAGVVGSKKYAGDVSFLKTQLCAQYSKSLDPVNDNVVFNLAGGSGLLWTYDRLSPASSLYDRFFLGGPNGGLSASSGVPAGVLLHAFKPSSIGPKDGGEPLGGDSFAAGTVSVTCKLPRFNSAWATEYLAPLRFIAYFSQVNVVALSHSESSDNTDSKNSFYDTFKNPSTAGGLGLVYKTPAAQLELVYSTPFVVSGAAKDSVKKGWQVGVGFEFDF